MLSKYDTCSLKRLCSCDARIEKNGKMELVHEIRVSICSFGQHSKKYSAWVKQQVFVISMKALFDFTWSQ